MSYNNRIENNNIDLQAILNIVKNLPEEGNGVELPDLTEPATEDEVFLNQEYIDANGEKKSGTFTIDEEMSTQNNLINQIQTALANKVSGGRSDIEDSIITGTITEYENNRVTSIGSYAFYYYPNLTTINFPNVDTIGSSAFEHCENLTTINFPKVLVIGGQAFFRCINLTTVDFPVATTIGSEAFSGCQYLTDVNFYNATTIGSSAFEGCENLTTINFPNVVTVKEEAFRSCYSLTTINCPNANTIKESAFNGCGNLITVDFSNITTIEGYAFNNCENLTSIIIRKDDTVCTLSSVDAFTATKVINGSGYIYVPKSLLENYKQATNWVYFANQFRALEDYTVDGTITGALDENKIMPSVFFIIRNGNTGEEAMIQIEEDMTWDDFINSEYNIDNRFTSSNDLVYCDGYLVRSDNYGTSINSPDIIDINDTYWYAEE